MAKQVRWKCEMCDDGLLAPSRPRKNDVRRYCLPCSAKRGTLVERTAPALEKKREKRTELIQQKNKEKRVRVAKKLQPVKERQARAKQRRAIFEKEADRIWNLFYPEGTFRKRPSIKIVFSRNRGCSGVNYGGSSILLRISRTSSGGADVWETLAHELCHSVVPTSSKNGSHGKPFYVALKNVVEKRWKVRMDWSSINGYTDSSHSWGYKVDWLMRAQLEKAGVVQFSYPPDQIQKQIKKKEVKEVQPKVIEPITSNDLVTIYIPKFFIEELEYNEFFDRTESAVADDEEWKSSCEAYGVLAGSELKRDAYKDLHEAFKKSKNFTGRGSKISVKASALSTLRDELDNRNDVADDTRILKLNEKLIDTITRYEKAIKEV